MNPEDADPSPEELEEAARLARALDRGHAESPPGDALETAALLRYAKDESLLDTARSQSILDDVLARARPPKKTRSFRMIVFGALGLSAAAAATFIVVTNESKLGPSELPAPPRALLDAQIQATAATAGLEPLGSELKPYRVAVYSVLREHYRR
jgi:hypothetical protein